MIGLGVAAVAVFVVVMAAYYVIRVGGYRAPTRADEIHTVVTPDLWGIRLCRYRPRKGRGQPVFVCHGFMSTQFNFAVPPGESLVDHLTEKGYDCWLVELRGTLSSMPPFGRTRNDATLDDYLLYDIPAAIDYIRKETGYGKVHWVGHSMGGMLLYALDAMGGVDHIASATTIGSPIGFGGVEFREPIVLLRLRRLSGLLLRSLTRPLFSLAFRLRPSNQVVPINWDNMSPNLDAGMLYSTFEVAPLGVTVQMAHGAAHREWRVRDDEIDVIAALKNLRTPLFAIFGAGDPFTPIAQAQAFFEKLPSADKQLLVLSEANGHAADYSHVDLVMGRKSTEEVYTPVGKWLRAHPITERYKPEAEQAGPVRSVGIGRQEVEGASPLQ